ncbi:MAG: ABC transporter permease [Planctomycetota bacterium]
MLLRTYLVLKSSLAERRHQKRLPLKTTSFQIFFTGIQALPIIILAGLVLGTAVIAELATILPTFGASQYIERLSIIVLVRELIPVITALIIIGRSGSAMATELGNMKLNREIELLDSLGINLDYFLVLPRLIGTVVSTVCLTVIFITVALVGGFLIAKNFVPASNTLIFNQLISALNYDDIIVSLLKAGLFGWVISIINCIQGLAVRKSFTEVPQVTTRGVMNSIIFCFIFSVFISLYVFPAYL